MMNAHQLEEAVRKAKAAFEAARKNKTKITAQIRDICKDLLEELSGLATGKRLGEAIFTLETKGSASGLMWTLGEVLMEFAPTKMFKGGAKLKNALPLLQRLNRRLHDAKNAERAALRQLEIAEEAAKKHNKTHHPAGAQQRVFNNSRSGGGLEAVSPNSGLRQPLTGSRHHPDGHQTAGGKGNSNGHKPALNVRPLGTKVSGVRNKMPEDPVPQGCCWQFKSRLINGVRYHGVQMSSPKTVGYWEVVKIP